MFYKLILLLLISVNLSAQGPTGGVTNNSSNKSRQNVVFEVFKQSVENFGQTPVAVLNILSNEKIVPQGGVVFSLSSGNNFYDWVLPILNREDIAVVVMEKTDQKIGPSSALSYGDIISRPNEVIPLFVSNAWKAIKNDPDLIRKSSIKTEADLVEAIKNQVVFCDRNDPLGKTLDVKADLVINRSLDDFSYGDLRNNGFVWAIKKSADNTFLLSDFKSNLFFPKNENASKYSSLYVSRFPTIKFVQGEYLNYGSIFRETDGNIKLPDMPYGGKILYVICETDEGIKVAYSNEIPNFNVDLDDPKAEILVTHRSLYKMLRSFGNIKGFLGSGEIILMPNGEVSSFTNRSNTFKSGKNNLGFSFSFFKKHGVKFSEKVSLVDYAEAKNRGGNHLSSIEKARFLIMVAKDPAMFTYYKSIIDMQKRLADLVKDEGGSPGRFVSETFLNDKRYSSSVQNFWATIEARLVRGECISDLVYFWMNNGLSQDEASVKIMEGYISTYKKSDKTEKVFYLTGQIKSEKQYVDDQLVTEKTFYISGNKESFIAYKDGVKQGAYHKYYDKLTPDGTNTILSESGFYYKDQRYGAYYFYYESGDKKSVLIYKTGTEQLLSTSEFYDKTGKLYRVFLYDEGGKLNLIEEFYPSGYKKHMIQFVNSQDVVAITYENSYEKYIINKDTFIGADLVDVLYQLNTPKIIPSMWSTEKVNKVEEILYSSQKPTSENIAAVFDYANYLASNSTDVNKLETVVNWLYKTYDGFSLDTQSLFMLSKSVVELKAEFEPNFFVSDQIDYKELSSNIRKYVKFYESNKIDTKAYEADVIFLFPLALQQLADNINAKFAKGIVDPNELITQEEYKIFTLVLNLMANDVYKSINADVKTIEDMRIAAKLLALKDLSEILKTKSTFGSDTHFWEYARANYIIDKAVVKAEKTGLITKEMLDIYNNKDKDLMFRSSRLKSGSRAF